MTTDITELAQREKFEAWFKSSFHPDKTGPYIKDQLYFAWKAAGAELVEALEKAQQHIARQEQILLNQDESLSIRRGELEAAQQERDNWRTSFDNERFRADKLKAHIDDIEPIRAAAEKLVRCKGRYHSELNYRALAALFGVNTPDLPPLDGDSRTVTDWIEHDGTWRPESLGLDELVYLKTRKQELKIPYPAGQVKGWMHTGGDMDVMAYRLASPQSRTVTPVTYSENTDADHCRKWAWEQVKGEVSTEEWTTGDNITYFGFFCWGWDMRRQYNEQRPVTVKLPSELELRNNEVCSVCAGNALQVIEDKLAAAGIKWEAE
ncbi:hypothetical protein [Klebsiella pneumoniae]|uniref:hypothetical protein n=1 Tax=Klebsiella pneumoniae TaxID=573 RepID=UPI003D6638AE